MKLEERRDQFAFFLGYAARKQNRPLAEALEKFVASGYQNFQPSAAFDYCPYNDGQEQVIRSFHIFENSKPADLPFNLQQLVGEFVFLVSAFIPPCCGDGRSFYCRNEAGDIFQKCDRCGSIYDLDGQYSPQSKTTLMVKSEFVEMVGHDSAECWPYPEKFKALCSAMS